MTTTNRFLVIMSLVTFCISSGARAENHEVSTESLSSFLSAIEEVHLPSDLLNTEEQKKAWDDVAIELNKHFRQYLNETASLNSLDALIKRFGTGDSIFDMKFFLVEPAVFLAHSYTRPAEYFESSQKLSGQPRDTLRVLQLSAARAQTREFIKYPHKLKRYYNALVWSRIYFGSPAFHGGRLGCKIGGLKERFTSNHVPDYWWYARDVVLLVHATSRDDLLKGVNPDNIYPVFRKWYTWILKEHKNLVSDRKSPVWRKPNLPHLFGSDIPPPLKEPSQPFPDWNKQLSVPSYSLIIQCDLLYCITNHIKSVETSEFWSGTSEGSGGNGIEGLGVRH